VQENGVPTVTGSAVTRTSREEGEERKKEQREGEERSCTGSSCGQSRQLDWHD
jgi:hypothetical protein